MVSTKKFAALAALALLGGQTALASPVRNVNVALPSSPVNNSTMVAAPGHYSTALKRRGLIGSLRSIRWRSGLNSGLRVAKDWYMYAGGAGHRGYDEEGLFLSYWRSELRDKGWWEGDSARWGFVFTLISSLREYAMGKIFPGAPEPMCCEPYEYYDDNNDDGCWIYSANNTYWQIGFSPGDNIFTKEDAYVVGCLAFLHTRQHDVCISVRGSECDKVGDGFYSDYGRYQNAHLPPFVKSLTWDQAVKIQDAADAFVGVGVRTDKDDFYQNLMEFAPVFEPLPDEWEMDPKKNPRSPLPADPTYPVYMEMYSIGERDC